MPSDPQRNDVPYAPPENGGIAAVAPKRPLVSKDQAIWIVGGISGVMMMVLILGFCMSDHPDPEKFGETIGKMLFYVLIMAALVANDKTRVAGVAVAVLGGVGLLAGMGMALVHPHKPTVAQIAAAANSHCPKQLDANTRMDAITSDGDRTLVYHYTVIGIDDDVLVGAKDQVQAGAATNLKSTNLAQILAGDDVTCVYVNTSGKEILRFTLHM
jgi:hypothetical protein